MYIDRLIKGGEILTTIHAAMHVHQLKRRHTNDKHSE